MGADDRAATHNGGMVLADGFGAIPIPATGGDPKPGGGGVAAALDVLVGRDLGGAVSGGTAKRYLGIPQ